MTRTPRHALCLAAPAFLYLLVLGVVAAVYLQPPVLGWIAFAVVVLVAAALTAVAVVLVTRKPSARA